MTAEASRRITVLVGTDHHDFTRVVRWADDWQRDHPDHEVLVQHGFSPAPSVASGVELVPPTQLVDVLTKADVVVTHGGPGTIMSARHAGHRPIAVPRDPGKGEHVDEHQMRFVSWAAAKGLCDRAESVEASRSVAALGAHGTRSDTQTAVGPALDGRRLDHAVAERRRRRAPGPSAVRVLYCADVPWTPAARPVEAGSMSLLVLGTVSALWLDGPEARCSCGASGRECTFWQAVVEHAFDGSEAGALTRVRSVHTDVRAHRAAAVRRHPGAERRRQFIELANAYRRVCATALDLSGADAVVDHGGPLADVLPLSHSREIDLRVLRPVTVGTSDALALAALHYRGVPLARSAGVPAPDPHDDRLARHQLAPPSVRLLQGSTPS